jgi:hypothetical protein
VSPDSKTRIGAAVWAPGVDVPRFTRPDTWTRPPSRVSCASPCGEPVRSHACAQLHGGPCQHRAGDRHVPSEPRGSSLVREEVGTRRTGKRYAADPAYYFQINRRTLPRQIILCLLMNLRFYKKDPRISLTRRRTSQERADMGPDSNSLPGAGWRLATSP